MNEKLHAWTVETADLTARIAAAVGTPPAPDLVEELRALRREVAELRGAVALLADEATRLRAAGAVRRIVPFGPAEGLVRLS